MEQLQPIQRPKEAIKANEAVLFWHWKIDTGISLRGSPPVPCSENPTWNPLCPTHMPIQPQGLRPRNTASTLALLSYRFQDDRTGSAHSTTRKDHRAAM